MTPFVIQTIYIDNHMRAIGYLGKKTRVPLREPYLVLVFQLITGEKPHFLSH